MRDKILFIMGVSGAGKSIFENLISLELLFSFFFEGDDFHPSENIKKMTCGIPLSDEDRESWLQALIRPARGERKSGVQQYMFRFERKLPNGFNGWN